MSKVIFITIFFSSLFIGAQAQQKETSFGLIKCQELVQVKKIRKCTNDHLLAELKIELQPLKEKIPKGVYFISYLVNSDGLKQVEKVIKLPRQVSEKKGTDILISTFQKVIDQQEWIPLKEIELDGVNSIKTGEINSIKLDTNTI